MPVTSPDNISYPDVSTVQDQPAYMATHAGSVQAALSKRQGYSYVWANATAQNAQTGMRAGDVGYRTDIQQEFIYQNGAWRTRTSPFAYREGSGTHPNNTQADASLLGARYQSNTAFVTAGENAFIISQAGYYIVSATINFATNANGIRSLEITVNNSNMNPRVASVSPAAGATAYTISSIVYLATNDIVRLTLFQNSGSSLGYACRLSIALVTTGTGPA